MNRTLISTDKNGTKTFHCVDRCFKCGGTGIINCYIPVNGGECFDCNGSGISEWTEKEYTPEYEAKLEARRQARYEKKLMIAKAHAAEKNQAFFEKQGFNLEGKTYFILGKTFDIKDQLKEAGAKWDNYSSHWHMNHIPEGMDYLEIDINEMYDADYSGTYYWNSWKRFDPEEDPDCYYNKIQRAEQELKATNSTSEYLGSEGDKLTLKVTYLYSASFENTFGYRTTTTYIHSFKDENGNEIIWKTSNNLPHIGGESLIITGTVKGYKEYKGIKQTILTRCKLQEV